MENDVVTEDISGHLYQIDSPISLYHVSLFSKLLNRVKFCLDKQIFLSLLVLRQTQNFVISTALRHIWTDFVQNLVCSV